MDLKEFKTIVEIMKRADLCEFEIEEEGFKLRIKRATGKDGPAYITTGTPPGFPVVSGGTPPPFPVPSPGAESTTGEGPSKAKEAAEEAGVIYIKSPIIGTFYRAASPESPAFVEVGDVVTEETVVGIIEAMKVMNEIQAETRGKIVEILIENGKSVEYGQPLFKLKTS